MVRPDALHLDVIQRWLHSCNDHPCSSALECPGLPPPPTTCACLHHRRISVPGPRRELCIAATRAAARSAATSGPAYPSPRSDIGRAQRCAATSNNRRTRQLVSELRQWTTAARARSGTARRLRRQGSTDPKCETRLDLRALASVRRQE